MIISKTPFRISFAGGLSDLKDFYSRAEKGGCVISATINKYLYMTVNKMFDEKFRIKYSKEEIVDEIDEIKHPLVRECLRLVGVVEPVEIVCTADVFGRTGLGSSSAFTVGLLNALYAYSNIKINKHKLAEDACKVEIDVLGEPIGKQDQYAASYGGLNRIEFKRNAVNIVPIPLNIHYYNKLQDNLLLLYTGLIRKSKDILSTQKKNMDRIFNTVDKIADIARDLDVNLRLCDRVNDVGEYLHEEWALKKESGKVSNDLIDDFYERALDAGCMGGKLCGAGAGGFLLLYCEEDKQDNLRKELSDLKELPFGFEEHGSSIIYVEG